MHNIVCERSKMENQLVYIGAQVPVELDLAVRIVAAHARTDKSNIMRIALQEYIAKHNPKILNVTYLQPTPDCIPVPVVEVERAETLEEEVERRR
jgi:hypothetical protein